MKKAKIFILCTCVFALSAFLACDNGDELLSSDNQNSSGDVAADNRDDYTFTVDDVLANNCDNHEESSDYTWNNSQVINIVLNDNGIVVNGSGTTINGSKLTITTGGTYSLNGTLSDGQIVVDSDDNNIVRLVLNGIDITNSTSAPFYIKNSKKTVIVLNDNTENKVTDKASYVYEDTAEEEPNATIFSKDDLSIYGNGKLVIDANFNDGISCKDGIVIAGGNIEIDAVDDGIRGKDYLVVKDGDISINCSGDGLKSDNDADSAKGYVYIENGNFDINSGADAISGQSDVLISHGTFDLTSGKGSSGYSSGSVSTKGIKAGTSLIIDNGELTINSSDDAVHSNGNLVINGGDITISSGDDGLHADSYLGVNGGDVNIQKSYEGIESRIAISLNGGNIFVTSSDDGINAAGGGGSEGGWGGPGGGSTGSGNYYLYINGGYIVTNAVGDGFDINGSILMTGGEVIVNGPTSNANGAIDYDRAFKITDGLFIAAGSAGMAQAPGTASTQYSVLINFRSTFKAGTLINVQSSSGEEILTFSPLKTFRSLAFSSSKLKSGSTYNIYYGGSSTGTVNNGLYENGTYTPGTKYGSFTISSVVTKI